MPESLCSPVLVLVLVALLGDLVLADDLGLAPVLVLDDDLIFTGRAPSESGLKRPPWDMVCSWDLKWASCGAHDAVREVKSSGFSGSGCGPLLLVLLFASPIVVEEDEGLEVLKGGLLLAAAIVRFFWKEVEEENGRSEGADTILCAASLDSREGL